MRCGGFGAAPQLGKVCAHRGDAGGEFASWGSTFSQVGQACAIGDYSSSKRILEHVAGILPHQVGRDGFGAEIGEVHGELVMAPTADRCGAGVGGSATARGVQHRHRIGIGVLPDQV